MIQFSTPGLILFGRGSRLRKCAVRVSICCPEIGPGRGETDRQREKDRDRDRQEGRFELPEPDFTADCLVTL
jgi:hypothetical protein